MTSDDFRRIALSIPGTVESRGLGYPSFRASGRSFATIEDDVPVIRLNQQQQKAAVAAAPTMFAPVPGGWGLAGHTAVRLDVAVEVLLRDALTAAWRNINDSFEGEAPTPASSKVNDELGCGEERPADAQTMRSCNLGDNADRESSEEEALADTSYRANSVTTHDGNLARPSPRLERLIARLEEWSAQKRMT